MEDSNNDNSKQKKIYHPFATTEGAYCRYLDENGKLRHEEVDATWIAQQKHKDKLSEYLKLVEVLNNSEGPQQQQWMNHCQLLCNWFARRRDINPMSWFKEVFNLIIHASIYELVDQYMDTENKRKRYLSIRGILSGETDKLKEKAKRETQKRRNTRIVAKIQLKRTLQKIEDLRRTGGGDKEKIKRLTATVTDLENKLLVMENNQGSVSDLAAAAPPNKRQRSGTTTTTSIAQPPNASNVLLRNDDMSGGTAIDDDNDDDAMESVDDVEEVDVDVNTTTTATATAQIESSTKQQHTSIDNVNVATTTATQIEPSTKLHASVDDINVDTTTVTTTAQIESSTKQHTSDDDVNVDTRTATATTQIEPSTKQRACVMHPQPQRRRRRRHVVVRPTAHLVIYVKRPPIVLSLQHHTGDDTIESIPTIVRHQQSPVVYHRRSAMERVDVGVDAVGATTVAATTQIESSTEHACVTRQQQQQHRQVVVPRAHQQIYIKVPPIFDMSQDR